MKGQMEFKSLLTGEVSSPKSVNWPICMHRGCSGTDRRRLSCNSHDDDGSGSEEYNSPPPASAAPGRTIISQQLAAQRARYKPQASPSAHTSLPHPPFPTHSTTFPINWAPVGTSIQIHSMVLVVR